MTIVNSDTDIEVSTTELAPLSPSSVSALEFEQLTNEAAQKARHLTKIIQQQADRYIVQVGPNKFLRYEAWATIAAGFGQQAGVEEYEVLKNAEGYDIGVKATAVVRNLSGEKVGGAPGFCMTAEPGWSARSMAQIASMAGTRAASKALRLGLSWVVVLAGYEPTTAEEIDDNLREKILRESRTSAPNRSERPVEAPIQGEVAPTTATHGTCPLHGEDWRLNTAKDGSGRTWLSHRNGEDENGKVVWCNETSVKRMAQAVSAPPKPPPTTPEPEAIEVGEVELGEEEDEEEIQAVPTRGVEEELARALAEQAKIPWEEFIQGVLNTETWEEFESLGGTADIAATRLKKTRGG